MTAEGARAGNTRISRFGVWGWLAIYSEETTVQGQKVMDFSLNMKAFLKGLRLSEMSGHQKFVAMASLGSRGKAGLELATSEVRKQWRRSVIGQDYNPVFYERAQQEGWVDRVEGKKGFFTINQSGLDHVLTLERANGTLAPADLQQAGGLVVINRKATHSFDKYLRKILLAAREYVWVADSYVDGTVFDTVLDAIPQACAVRLLFGRAMDGFAERANRFSRQWPQYFSKRYKHLHDRFVVVDNLGYVFGPSLKDAAANSPALLVALDPIESRLLKSFFQELWQKGAA